MKNKKKEENTNRLHKEYGAWSNFKYIAGKMAHFDHLLIPLIILTAITAPVMNYLWTFISKFVIDAITEHAEIKKLIITMIIAFAVQAVFTMLQSCVSAENWWRYVAVRFKMMSEKNHKVMSMNFQNLEDSDVMDCYQKAGNACNNNQNGVEGMMHLFERLFSSLTVVGVGLIIMGSLSVPIMIGMAALALLNFFLKNRTAKRTKKEVWDPLAPWWRKNYYIQDVISNFAAAKDIRMFNMKEFLLKKYRKLSRERIEAQQRNEKLWWITGQIGNVLWFVSQVALYAWLVYSIIAGTMTIGNFTLYLGAAATFFNYILTLLDILSDILSRSREIDDWRSFMDIDKDIEECGEQVPKYDSYEFTFENVSFKYPKAETYALKNLNLKVKAGERLAVVGLNGAGKTTFIKLLLRLYDPTEGRILLNGRDIKEFNRASYYEVFSPVFQEVNLFGFPLAENVSMDTTENTDIDRAKRCADDAGLGEKIDSLDKGMMTEILKVIDDDGIDLSGGEKQKLALSRALYKDAPVVVLDEPTAALDALAESKLYQDFDKLIGPKTAVYISHRLSSTQFCAHVAMFEGGELVEYGTHESLLSAGGRYSEMFNVQAQYYIEEEQTQEKNEDTHFPTDTDMNPAGGEA